MGYLHRLNQLFCSVLFLDLFIHHFFYTFVLVCAIIIIIIIIDKRARVTCRSEYAASDMPERVR